MCAEHYILYAIILLVHPKIVMHGPMQVSIGANVSINCIVAADESPTPVMYITTPTGKVINASEISFTATLNNTGTYYCLGITHNILLKAKHHLLVVNGK